MLRYRTIPLFRIRRTAVRVDPALLLGMVYLGWILTERYQVFAQLREVAKIDLTFTPGIWAFLVIAGGLVGLILHELAHCLMTRLNGGRTRTVVLSLLGGRSEIVAPGRSAQVEWRSALAGPVMSIILGLGLLLIAGRFGFRDIDVNMALGDLGRFHLLYGVANLVPAFPLDGGRAFRALWARKNGLVAATQTTSNIGKALAIACVIMAIYTRTIPLLFIAIFLWAGAVMEERHEWVVSPIEGLAVRDAMVAGVGPASLHDLVGDAVIALQRSGVSALPIVADDGATVGAVGIRDLRAVPPRRLWSTTVGDLMPRIGGVVRTDADLPSVRRVMNEAAVRAVAVVEPDGTLVGVLPISAIERRISTDEIILPQRRPVAVPEAARERPRAMELGLDAGASLSTPLA